MLGAAVIGLQTVEAQPRRRRHRLRQRQGCLRRHHSAAPAADIDLDQHPDLGPRLGHRRGQRRHPAGIVDADRNPRHPRQPRQPGQRLRLPDLVRDQHVAQAGAHQGLRLADLLAAQPDRPGRHLQ